MGVQHRLLHLRDVAEILPTSVMPCCCKPRFLFQGALTDLLARLGGDQGCKCVTRRYAMKVKAAHLQAIEYTSYGGGQAPWCILTNKPDVSQQVLQTC